MQTFEYIPTLCTSVQQLGHEANLSLPSTATVKNEWSYTSTPPNTFMAITGATLPSPCNHHPLPRLRMCGATPHSCTAGCLIMQRDKSALPTTSLEQCPSSEVNSSMVSHDILHILWNPQSSLLSSQQPATRLYSEPDKLTLPYASEL